MPLRISALFMFLAIAGCATAPPRAPGGTAPFPAALSICRAMTVSNAPDHDANGVLRGFHPVADVRGVAVARAPAESACLSSGYGPRRGGAGSFHRGVDLYTRTPAPVRAAADGEVISASTHRSYGRLLIIRHRNGVETLYAHLSSFAPGVKKGARVAAGEMIGATGRSGNASAVHLHYEIRVDGEPVNPLSVGP